MLINLKKFKNKEIFDRNYFLYFEEFDLCKSTNDKGGQVYSSSDLKVYHLGFKGSLGSKNSLKNEANKLRDWHWMWSYFYFYKKNYNYFYALIKISSSCQSLKTASILLVFPPPIYIISDCSTIFFKSCVF